MNSKIKILIGVLLVGVIAGFAVLQVQNKGLFKGQIFDDKAATGEVKLPDIQPKLEVVDTDKNGNLRVRTTFTNIGEGIVEGNNPYSYTLYINGQLVLTNTDSYSQMDPGDTFSFIYPIDKEMYKYPNKGTIKIVVDSENKIKESNKDNNTAEVAYQL
jgi:subtilase family serine protease